MSDRSFDVVIVGGGLAGSAAASVLARDGFEVLVLERETTFRDRVRGEWLSPWGIVELDALGLRDVADSVPRVNLITNHVGFDDTISPDRADSEEFDLATLPGGGCLAVGHPEFQEAMLRNAVEEGATVVRGAQSVLVSPAASPAVSFEHDVLDEIGGSEARLQVDKSFQFGLLRFTPKAGLNWLSSQLSNHDFGVSDCEATVERPAYDLNDTFSIEGGFGLFIEVTRDWLVIANTGVELLDEQVTDSPIVEKDYVVKGFLAINYLF